MVWNVFELGSDKNITLAKAVEFVKSRFEDQQILKSATVKADKYDKCKYAMYCAIKNKNGRVYGAVILLDWSNSKNHKILLYKTITEEMEPLYYRCPADILGLLSSTVNKSAIHWRNANRKNLTGATTPE